MKLVEVQIIKESHQHYKGLLDLLHKSKNLYNAAIYTVRQFYFESVKNNNEKKYLNYYETYKIFSHTKNIDYYSLPADISQSVLKQVDRNFKSFFALLKKKQTGKYNKPLNIPKYKDKDGYNGITINVIQLGVQFKKDGILTIPNTAPNKIQFKVKNYSTCTQVRFIPCKGYIKLEAIYNYNEPMMKEDNGNYLSIDLGINNLCTCTSNITNSFLIDGRKLKQINQKYNKQKGKLQSKLPSNKFWSHKLSNITKNRNFKINNYLHNCSAYIVNQAVSNNINTIIIGYNKEWKQDINIGRINNQKFTGIPFYTLVNQIIYKGQMKGIRVILQEESYTSKASFFDNDVIPTYKEGTIIDSKNFSGQRVKRGLYKTKSGLLINADVNGSLNILRKYLKCNSDAIIQPADMGFVVNPLRINL